MTPFLVGVFMMAAPVDAPMQPVAMVLMTKGTVRLIREDKARTLEDMDLLQPGDTLRIAANSSAKIVILSDGHREEVPAGTEVKLNAEGCQPAEGIKREPSKLSAAQLTNLRKMAQSQRGGVVVIRSGNAPPKTTTVSRTPLNGSTIFDARPMFKWGTFPDVLGYRVELFQVLAPKPDKLIWKAEPSEAHIAYPASAAVLSEGSKYRWQVTALLGSDQEQVIVNSRFALGGDDAETEVKRLQKLADSEDAEDWVEAASTLESLGAYDAALPLFERLAMKYPESVRYAEVLAEYYQRAGNMDKAAAASAKAKKLSGTP